MADVAGGRQEIEQKVVQRAQEDPAFRLSLLADAKATIEQELGASLPAGLRVQAVEESSNTIYVVIPQTSTVGSDELSDQDLEAVAGGWGTAGSTSVQSCGYVC